MNDDGASTAAAASSGALTVSPSSDAGTPIGDTEGAAAKALPSVVKIYASGPEAAGSGSGIVLTRNGEILTNNHVVELAADGGKLAVTFNDGTSTKATILGRDPLTDLAVIKADGQDNLTPATLGNSDDLKVGQQVVALGAPFGLESTVTTGIVSALNRPVSTQGESPNDPTTVFPAIQTDAAINPGNSGGPLIDLDGNVVGIDSAIKTATSSTEGGQGGSIGLGFAIPIDDAIPIVQELRAGETPTHARIGVEVGNATDSMGLPAGALVGKIDSGTAAAEAGLQSGDVITQVDNEKIDDSDSLIATVRSYRPGEKVTLTIAGSTGKGVVTGDTHTVDITLGSDNS